MKPMKFRLLTTISLLLTTILCFAEDYPVPEKRQELLFYIQRNHNANTIVYDAIFDAQGDLDSQQPVSVYWIRYQEQGQTMKLRTIERMFAYGARSHRIRGVENEFNLKLVAKKDKDFRLVQTEKNKAVVYTTINDQECILDHMYIFADNTKLRPKVKYVEVFGFDKESGEEVYEKIIINE